MEHQWLVSTEPAGIGRHDERRSILPTSITPESANQDRLSDFDSQALRRHGHSRHLRELFRGKTEVLLDQDHSQKDQHGFRQGSSESYTKSRCPLACRTRMALIFDAIEAVRTNYLPSDARLRLCMQR